VSYVIGSAKSTVDYIMVRQGDKVKVRNVKVIPNEECVPKHKLLVKDMRYNTTKRRHKKFASSVILPIYKAKGDPMECGSYRGIKLLEHSMKVVERTFEHRIWQQIVLDDTQFGFMKGKGTTHAIFTVRQMQENFRVKGKKVTLALWMWKKLLIGFREK